MPQEIQVLGQIWEHLLPVVQITLLHIQRILKVLVGRHRLPGTFRVKSINVGSLKGAAQKFWTVGPPAFVWTQTGPLESTTGSGQYAFHQKSSTLATGIDPRLISPWIDLDTLSTPELSFWYHGYGQQMGDLDVISKSKAALGHLYGILLGCDIRLPMHLGWSRSSI